MMAISGTNERRPMFINLCGIPSCSSLYCRENWMPKVTLSIIFSFMMLILIVVFQPFQLEINVLVISGNQLWTTNEKFLSVALDSSLIASGFAGFNMSDPKLLTMMKLLGGGYLRIGGTMADRLHFVSKDGGFGFEFKTFVNDLLDGDECDYDDRYCMPINRPNFTMSAREWKELNRLAILTNFTILFDLNSLIRKDDGSWNSKNAEELIAYSSRHGFPVIWQLGNEPNAYKHTFQYSVSATQLAKDFQQLKLILKKYHRYENALIVGPDITKPRPHAQYINKYLADFLDNVGNGVINAATWHQYYFRGKDSDLSSFINPLIFDNLALEIDVIKSVVYNSNLPKIPIWLGETSSACGGGAPGFSDRFISTFIWMDKLGLSAKHGLDLVIRQSLFKGYYALLDANYDPNPDWWLSVMYKRLVGNKVIDCSLLSSPEVRMYCHCLSEEYKYSKKPAIVVFGMNMKYSDAVIRLQVPNYDENLYNIESFIFQTYTSILSKRVYCNSYLLKMVNNKWPLIQPIDTRSNQITLPPFSFGFWIIYGYEFSMCS